MPILLINISIFHFYEISYTIDIAGHGGRVKGEGGRASCAYVDTNGFSSSSMSSAMLCKIGANINIYFMQKFQAKK